MYEYLLLLQETLSPWCGRLDYPQSIAINVTADLNRVDRAQQFVPRDNDN